MQADGGIAPVFKPAVLHGNGWLAARSTTLGTGRGGLVSTGRAVWTGPVSVLYTAQKPKMPFPSIF